MLARAEIAQLVDSLIFFFQTGHINFLVHILHDLRVLLIVETHHVHSVVRVVIVIVHVVRVRCVLTRERQPDRLKLLFAHAPAKVAREILEVLQEHLTLVFLISHPLNVLDEVGPAFPTNLLIQLGEEEYCFVTMHLLMDIAIVLRVLCWHEASILLADHEAALLLGSLPEIQVSLREHV